MDLFDLVRVLLRRWYVVVPLGVLTIALAIVVQTTVAPEYEAFGQLVFETPAMDAATARRPSVDPVALAESTAMGGGEPNREYTVSALGGMNYAVSAVGPSLEAAVTEAELVVEQLAELVRAVQDEQGVPVEELVELRTISQVAPQPAADGTFLAEVRVFLYDPVAATNNPYQPNAATGRLLEVAVTSDAGLIEFQRRVGPDVEFQVGQQARDAAPIVQIITIGSEEGAVLDAFYVVRDMLVEALRAREERAGVLPSQRLSLEVIDAPLGVIDNSPPVSRATAGVVALGGLLTLGLTFAVEGVSRRRRRSTSAGSGSSGEGDAQDGAGARSTDGESVDDVVRESHERGGGEQHSSGPTVRDREFDDGGDTGGAGTSAGSYDPVSREIAGR